MKKLRQEMKLEIAKYIDRVEELRTVDTFVPRNVLEDLVLNGWKEGLSLESVQIFNGKLNILNLPKLVQDIAQFSVDYNCCLSLPKTKSASDVMRLSSSLRVHSDSLRLATPTLHDQMTIQPKPSANLVPSTQPNVLSVQPDSTSALLPVIVNNTLKLYDFPSGDLKSSATLSQSFNSGTVYCLLGKETVLCVGSNPPCSKVYSLDLSLGALLPDSHMNIDRAWPGIITVGGFVYIFGGNWPSVRSAEKYSILSHNWSFLPRMQNPRYAFTPCLHQGLIYLCDLCNSRVLEAFTILSEKFTIVDVVLPDIKCNCVTFIVNGEMLVVTNSNHLARWDIRGRKNLFDVSPITLPNNNAAVSCCPPVKVGEMIFYVQYDTGEIRVFSPALNTLR